MSAQLSHHVSTRLLVAEKSENAAHELDSSLRDAGIATKLTISDDLAHIAQILAAGDADIALLTDKIDGLDKILPRIRDNAPHTPVIVLSSDDSADVQSLTPTQALELGATDLVPHSRFDQLALVVKRELEHVCQREHFAQTRRALSEAEQRCQLLLQGSKAAIAYVHEGMHIHANEGYLDLFDYADVEELSGESLVDILSADSATQLKAELKTMRNGATETVFEFTGKNEEIRGNMTLSNSQYEGEDCLQITVRQETSAPTATTEPPDVVTESASAQTNDELALSGFVKAAEALAANDSGKTHMVVAAIDNTNEHQRAYGLLGAETINRKVWQKFVELCGDHPTARINAHQYGLAIFADDAEAARQTLEHIRHEMDEYIFEVQDKTVRPTITIAGALICDDKAGEALDTAFERYQDLLEAKTTNTVTLPSEVVEDDGEESSDARIILRQITEAIEKKMFVLLFQPIISLRGDSDEHYEVFLRMTDEEGTQIEPSRFLQTAIDNNVAGKIDRWVILQSIKMLSVHRAKGHTTRLTINLTSNSVNDAEFLQWLGVAIKAARLPSDAVIFQITEKDATTYLRQTREFVEGLRDMHCQASLSRFGLIDNPFETLQHIPVDIVKLDGACVQDMESSDEREAVIQTINKLQGAGKLTVVPMVENANVLSTLWQAGANYIQGHYLQEPTMNMDYDFSTEE